MFSPGILKTYLLAIWKNALKAILPFTCKQFALEASNLRKAHSPKESFFGGGVTMYVVYFSKAFCWSKKGKKRPSCFPQVQNMSQKGLFSNFSASLDYSFVKFQWLFFCYRILLFRFLVLVWLKLKSIRLQY